MIRYSEGLRRGYRWFQSEGIAPLFPFGYGQSHTTFDVAGVSLDAGGQPGSGPVTVRATVTNTGGVAGAEVVQVYLGLPAGTGQPPERLVGFQKVAIPPGERREVEIVVDPAATNHPLSVWRRGEHAFVVPPGEFTVYVGTSSEDTPFRETFTVSG